MLFFFSFYCEFFYLEILHVIAAGQLSPAVTIVTKKERERQEGDRTRERERKRGTFVFYILLRNASLKSFATLFVIGNREERRDRIRVCFHGMGREGRGEAS